MFLSAERASGRLVSAGQSVDAVHKSTPGRGVSLNAEKLSLRFTYATNGQGIYAALAREGDVRREELACALRLPASTTRS